MTRAWPLIRNNDLIGVSSTNPGLQEGTIRWIFTAKTPRKTSLENEFKSIFVHGVAGCGAFIDGIDRVDNAVNRVNAVNKVISSIRSAWFLCSPGMPCIPRTPLSRIFSGAWVERTPDDEVHGVGHGYRVFRIQPAPVFPALGQRVFGGLVDHVVGERRGVDGNGVRRQCRKLLLVEAGEALGFGGQIFKVEASRLCSGP